MVELYNKNDYIKSFETKDDAYMEWIQLFWQKLFYVVDKRWDIKKYRRCRIDRNYKNNINI